MFEPQPSADIGIGNPFVGFGQGSPSGLDVEPVLCVLDQPFQELQVLDGNNRRGILAPPVDDDSFPLILGSVENIGQRLSKINDVKPSHAGFSTDDFNTYRQRAPQPESTDLGGQPHAGIHHWSDKSLELVRIMYPKTMMCMVDSTVNGPVTRRYPMCNGWGDRL
jgi:hypothetical protein